MDNIVILQLGRYLIYIILKLGNMAFFLLKGLVNIFIPPFQLSKVFNQIHFIGVRSIFVICLTASFTGMVLALQGYYTLVKFGSEGMLGSLVALTIIRELGPVLTAIMVVARAGSSIAAEIGIMRISEHIDALETMDIDPIRFLVSPKFAASIICFPILTTIFDIVGILGGYLIGSFLLNLNSGLYFYRVQNSVEFIDVKLGLIKSFVFGIIVTLIACYNGYNTHLQKEGFGAKGVSLSTTSAVVQSSVIILLLDYVITSIFL